MIPFYPNARENKYILKKYKSVFNKITNCGISLKGQYNDELKKYLEKKHFGYKCHLVGSATDALYLAVKHLKCKRVAVPGFTYKATYWSIVRAGATPVPIDVHFDGTLNVEDLRGKKFDAIIYVSLFGKINSDVYKIPNVKIIEDAAQSDFGYAYHCKNTIPDATILSFSPTKIFSCMGTGGALLLKDEDVYRKTLVELITYLNSEISEFNALLTLIKMQRYNFKKRQTIARKFKQIPRRHLHDENDVHAISKYVIRTGGRDDLMKKLKRKGIPTLVHYQYTFLKESPVINLLMKQVLSLPFHDQLRPKEIESIIKAIK